MTIDWTAILTALIALLGAVLTGIAAPYLRSKTTLAQREAVLSMVSVAVTAAEQLYGGSGMGETKKNYVLRWLSARGINLEDAELDALIEAAVYELKSWGGALA